MNDRKCWLIGPVAYVAFLACLFLVWGLVEPARLVPFFDQGGFSPFELLTLPFFAAIVPLVWWKCPFEGSRRRRIILSTMVSVVAIFAIVKETDLHLAILHSLYPNIVGEDGSMLSGLFKPDGRPLTGTPFKMRVLTNAGVPFGLKAFACVYFAAFFGTFAAGFAYLLPTWVKGVFGLKPSAWAWGCFGASGVLVQIADRLPAWLGHAGGLGQKHGEVVTAATALCTCLEEGGELMIALFALLTIWLSGREVKEGVLP